MPLLKSLLITPSIQWGPSPLTGQNINVSLPCVSIGNCSSHSSPIVSSCLVSCRFTLYMCSLLISRRLRGPVVSFLELSPCLSAWLPCLWYSVPQIPAASSSSCLDFCLLNSARPLFFVLQAGKCFQAEIQGESRSSLGYSLLLEITQSLLPAVLMSEHWLLFHVFCLVL